jgi:chromosomal replication initiation ATPase DnaA
LQQLSLDLPIKENSDPYLEEDFVLLDENSAAVNFLSKFFAQKKFSQAQFPSLLLRGPAQSGKTHILNIFAKKFQAEFLQIAEISDQNLSSFFSENKFYILENINEIADEKLLFHLVNAAAESKAFLILSSQNKAQFELKDLSSRIKNIFALEIKNPSQEAIKMLLINAFSRKQLKVSKGVIDFIASHSERTFEAVVVSVKLVEFYTAEVGKNITIKEMKKILY